MGKISAKSKLERSTLKPGSKSLLIMVKEKIKRLNHKIQPRQTKPICNPDVKSYLGALLKPFVLTIGNAANHVAKSKIYLNAVHSIKKIM